MKLAIPYYSLDGTTLTCYERFNDDHLYNIATRIADDINDYFETHPSIQVTTTHSIIDNMINEGDYSALIFVIALIFSFLIIFSNVNN